MVPFIPTQSCDSNGLPSLIGGESMAISKLWNGTVGKRMLLSFACQGYCPCLLLSLIGGLELVDKIDCDVGLTPAFSMLL